MQKNQFTNDITVVKSLLKSWEILTPEEIHFERLAGLSNIIWKVSSNNTHVSPSSIIYRKFGDAGAIIDREKENYIFHEMSRYGMGPSCYGFTDKVRIEEFYSDSRALSSKEINKKFMRRNLAKSLASFHRLKLEKLDQKPMFLKILEDKSLTKIFEEKLRKTAFNDIEQKFLQEMQELLSEDEIYYLLELLPSSDESIVFSHNDLHAANVLLLNKTNRLVLIDYEYSAYNYRGYDIANLFNESIINYSYEQYPYYNIEEKNYPTDYDIVDFIKYYLFFFKFGEDKSINEILILKDESLMKKHIEAHDNLKNFNLEVEKIFDEVKVCAMLSHYYWILWAVIMSKNSDINFDYIHYAYSRYKIYQKLKQNYYYSEYPKMEQMLSN